MLHSLWNPKKRGTLIFSTYRSGTHFLMRALAEHIKFSKGADYLVAALGEFHNADEQIDFSYLTNLKSDYTIGIINSSFAKFFLTGKNKDLEKWHVVHLTRHDKISHFISEYVWRFNPTEVNHHGCTADHFENLKNNKVYYELYKVVNWLKEDLINYLFPCAVCIDYEDLQLIKTIHVTWQPNHYNLQLFDLFTNSTEIENLLKTYIQAVDQNRPL